RRGMKPRPSDRVVTVSASFVRLLRKVWVFHRNHPVACSAAFSQLENLVVAPQHFSRADLALCGDPEQTVINKFKSDRAPVICVTFRLPDGVQCDSARSGARPGAKHEVILVLSHLTSGAPMTRTSQTNARDTGTGATATPATGVQFPADAAGNRSTGQLAKHVVAEALRTVDPAAADRVYRITDWRKGYIAPFTELVSVGVTDSDAWDEVARTALEELQTRMVGVHTVDGETVETPMKDYLAVVDTPSPTPSTETIEGKATPVEELSIPYRGEELTGAALSRQLDRWVHDGVIEPSCADALRRVQEHPEWLRMSGRSMLVLGLGSEMGPARQLLRWGADVLGVDLPSSPAWERFRAEADTYAGRLHIPTGPDGRPGVDLLTQLPEIAAWARAAAPAPLTVGSYFYADGGTHVRLSSAADALVVDLLADGTADALAYIATP